MTEQPMSRAELLARARAKLAELDAEAERLGPYGQAYQVPLRRLLRESIPIIQQDEGETP